MSTKPTDLGPEPSDPSLPDFETMVRRGITPEERAAAIRRTKDIATDLAHRLELVLLEKPISPAALSIALAAVANAYIRRFPPPPGTGANSRHLWLRAYEEAVDHGLAHPYPKDTEPTP